MTFKISLSQSPHFENDHPAAYGSSHLGQCFHETKQGVRITIREPARREVLQRLLKRNHERYPEEVKQGLHGKKGAAKKAAPMKKPTSKSTKNSSTLFDMDESNERDIDAMTSKLFVRIDRGSIAQADFVAMISASRVSPIDAPEDCFQFCFERICLDHAMLLLGENKSRFGFDLWHYLYSAQGLIGRISDGFVVMPNGSPDFKRRYSEDLGVAIGSPFLANCIDLRLETVAQIPTNTRLDKHSKVTDFVGFDGANLKRIYECKGTTAPDDVDKHRQKAKSQLADHNEANVTKFAMVTYVPTSSKLIPPFIFVSDPPIPLPRLTLAVATGLHLVLVLKFSGLESPIKPLQQMLAMWIKLEQTKAAGETVFIGSEAAFQNEKQQFRSVLGAAVGQSETIQFNGQSFAGVRRLAENQGQVIKVFTGVDVDHVLAVGNALADSEPEATFNLPRYQQVEATLSGTEVGNYSCFSDGSLLYVEPIS